MKTHALSLNKSASSKGNKIHFISLGCPRNLVDTEIMLGTMLKAGYEVVEYIPDADFLVLNTCAFLKSAREESIDNLLELIQNKKSSAKIIVTGCMVSDHKNELLQYLSDIHYFLSSGSPTEILKAVQSEIAGEDISARSFIELGEVPRKLSTPKNYAYLKIAEGCRKKCSFCTIPSIKGALKSKPIEQVKKEALTLINQGVKEIILIAQDLGDYGKDLSPNNRTSYLEPLLQELIQIPGNFFIRLLYLYPDEITDSLIEIIKSTNKILKYIDMPIQHINNRILKDMRRLTSGSDIKMIIEKLRTNIPNIYIRTSIIIGFPGETDEEFEELKIFISEAKLQQVGFFEFSPEEGTHAATMDNQISKDVINERLNIIIHEQKKVVEIINSNLIKRKINVIVEGFHPESEMLLIARHYGQAPDIDGFVILNDWKHVSEMGEFYTIQITGSSEYDLIGRVIKKSSEFSNFVKGCSGECKCMH